MKRLSMLVLLCLCVLLSGCGVSQASAQRHIDKGLDLQEDRLYGEAVKEYTAAIDLEPSSEVLAHALSLRATTYVLMEEYELALADADASLKLNPTAAETYLSRGYVYLEFERWADALADFDKVIELDDQQNLAYLGRATAHIQLGQPDLAVVDYQESLKVAPDQPDADAIQSAIDELQEMLKQ